MREALTRLPKRVLELPGGFDLYQRLVGAPEAKRRFVTETVRPRPGDRVLDIGCGTGALCAHVPPGATYVGVDIDADYIEAAKASFGDRAEFVCSPIESFASGEFGRFDVAMAYGVFHHLDDAQVRSALGVVRDVLEPNGRLVLSEPVRAPGQGRLERFVMDHDRGRYIRTEAAYRALLEEAFSEVSATNVRGTYRMPFTVVLLEARAPRS